MNQGCQGHHKLNSSDSNRKCGVRSPNGETVDFYTDADAAGNHAALHSAYESGDVGLSGNESPKLAALMAAATRMDVDNLATLLRKNVNHYFLIETTPSTLLVQQLTVKPNHSDERTSLITSSSSASPAPATASVAAEAQDTTLLAERIDNLKERYKSDNEAVHNELLRVYDFNKWMIGLMCTTVMGLLGLIVSNLVLSRRSETKSATGVGGDVAGDIRDRRPRRRTRESKA